MKKVIFATTLVCGSALAHVTLENPVAEAGTYAKVTLNVTHGCQGSPTKQIAVHVPAGFLLAKAKVKPGWDVSYEFRTLPKPFDLHGRAVTQTASIVRWQGGAVPSDQFDDFVLQGRLADDAPKALSFRVVQTCESGEVDWRGEQGSKEPAPVLRVAPARSGAHRH